MLYYRLFVEGIELVGAHMRWFAEFDAVTVAHRNAYAIDVMSSPRNYSCNKIAITIRHGEYQGRARLRLYHTFCIFTFSKWICDFYNITWIKMITHKASVHKKFVIAICPHRIE